MSGEVAQVPSADRKPLDWKSRSQQLKAPAAPGAPVAPVAPILVDPD